MIDGNSLLSQVGGKHGAPMGRLNITDNPESKVLLFRMRMVDSDYDAGGAYWGGGEPMYAAIGDDFEFFFRCQNIDEAKQCLLNDYPDLTIETSELNDDFFAAYVQAALWSSGDDETESFLDQYQQEDIHPDTLKIMMNDCKKFIDLKGHLITGENCKKENCWSQAGHDFFLTRNHHGAGFWDGDWEKSIGEELTTASHSFKACELYVGDDAKIHC